MKIRYFVAFNLLVCQSVLWAAETDQFTRRNEAIADSASIINQRANDSIKLALTAVNKEGKGCEEKDLYKELRGYFGNHMTGKFTIDIIKDQTIPRRELTLDESVYSIWSATDGIGIGLFLKYKSSVAMSPVLNVGGYTVGTDKFEHMFGQGFIYFNKNYLKGDGPIAAVKAGAFRERFMLGGTKMTNGVFSYGDLAANFNGMRFWNHMLQRRPDVLGSEHNIGPYIACQDNRWVQVKDVDFRSYIDPSMDEAINCSKFPSQTTADKFAEQVKAKGSACPAEPDQLQAMIAKYKHMAKWMINAEGTGSIHFTAEFED